MRARISIEEFKKRLYNQHKDVVILVDKSFIDMNTECEFFDKDYGIFYARPSNILRKNSHHPLRSKEIKIQKTKLKDEEVNKVLFDRKILALEKYINYHTKIKLKYMVCENIWDAQLANIVNGNGCPKCSFLEVSKKQRTDLKKVLSICEQQNVRLVSDFISMNKYCLFLCKICHYKWETLLKNINNGHGCPKCSIKKREKTCLEKYGTKSASQNPEIRKKILLSNNKITIKEHWKTGQQVYCQSGWEPKVIDYLNKNKIDFEWQIPFEIPDGRTYFLDLFLKEYNKYIEIKGYWYGDAKEKWEWFHKEYPNSELWDKKKLKELGIL